MEFCRTASLGSTVLFSLAILSAPPLWANRDVESSSIVEIQSLALGIDSENLIELYQSVADLKIFDSRYHEDRPFGYIESSISLPVADTNCASLSMHAANYSNALVFYGNAAEASVDAIKIASECGYQRLFWFRGGFSEWKDKDYPFVIE